jgi:WD40 repeat protein
VYKGLTGYKMLRRTAIQIIIFILSPLVLGLTYSTVAFAAQATELCDTVLASDYTESIDELAQGYLNLEKMRIEGASHASQITIQRELSFKREQIITEIGQNEFEQKFNVALKNLSAANLTEQKQTRKKRRQVIKDEKEKIQLWTPHLELNGQMVEMNKSALSPDGQYAVTVTYVTARIWNAKTGQLLHVLDSFDGYFTAVSFSADSRVVVTGSSQGLIETWDVSTGQNIFSFLAHSEEVNSVSFSPDNRYILSGSSDKTVVISEAKNGRVVKKLSDFEDGVRSATFSPDGKSIVTASDDGVIKTWNAKTFALIHSFQGHDAWIGSAVMSSDNRYILTASNDKTARLWDAKTKALIREFTGHTNWVMPAVFSPDQKYVLTGSSDGTIRLWDTKTAQVLHEIARELETVTGVSFSPNGQFILGSSTHGAAYIWQRLSVEDEE